MKFRVAAACCVVILLLCSDAVRLNAAIDEADVIYDMKKSARVMRYLYREMQDTREKLKMYRDTLALHEKQLATQQSLLQAERKRRPVHKIRVQILQNTYDDIKRQTTSLKFDKDGKPFNIEKTYLERLAELNKSVVHYKVYVEVKMIEYRAHFGKEPTIDLDFAAEESRYLARPLGLKYLKVK